MILGYVQMLAQIFCLHIHEHPHIRYAQNDDAKTLF